jgi:hypothetical protein
MELKKILAITGKPGLYKLIAQSRAGVIVESMEDGKRLPVMASQNVSTLGDIAIFTETGEKPLADIFRDIFTILEGQAAMSHKENASDIMTFFESLVPDYDRDRVYISDMKKVLQWYNTLHKHGLVDLEAEVAESTGVQEEQAPENA